MHSQQQRRINVIADHLQIESKESSLLIEHNQTAANKTMASLYGTGKILNIY